MIESFAPVCAARIDFSQTMICRTPPRRVPRALVERVVCLGCASLELNRQAEVVIRLAVARIRIAPGETCDCGAQVSFGRSEFTSPQVPTSERVVATAVAGIAP